MRRLESVLPSNKFGAFFACDTVKENVPRLHEVCEIPRRLSPSGRAEIVKFTWHGDAITPFWALYLDPVQVKPLEVCDEDYLREIST